MNNNVGWAFSLVKWFLMVRLSTDENGVAVSMEHVDAEQIQEISDAEQSGILALSGINLNSYRVF